MKQTEYEKIKSVQRFKALRTRARLTQAQTAELLGISYAAVRRIEAMTLKVRKSYISTLLRYLEIKAAKVYNKRTG